MRKTLIARLKEALEFKLDIEKEKFIKMKSGKEFFSFDGIKFIAYITENTVALYLDINTNINQEEIENKLNILFNRKIIVKKTFNNYVIPEGFYYTKKGMSIKRVVKIKGVEGWEDKEIIENISDKWIFVVSDVYSKENDIYQHEVKTVNPITREEITKLCNKDVLCQFRSCITFLSTSLNVNIEEGKRQDYTKFFFEFIKENGKFLEKKNTIPTLGWNETLDKFAPYDNSLHLDYSRDKYNFLKNMVNSFQNHNKNNIAEFKKRLLYHAKNPFADFAISCSFAAPLLKLVGVRSFLLNYYGESKTQKSLSIRIGLSVFGKYSSLEMSGTDTQNAIKSKIHKLQNLPCYVDEIVQKGKKELPIDAYSIGNEKDRQRLDKNSEIKECKTWRTIAMCSSESSISHDNDMSGEINRSLSLNVDCRPLEFQNGENENGCHNYAATYYRFLENNYGCIGEKYISEVIKIKDKLIKWYEQINNKMYEANKSKNLTDHIASISIVCLGNYIYRRLLYGIDDIYHSIGIGLCVLNHLKTKEELNPAKKYLNAIYEFYEVNKANFLIKDKNDYRPNQIYGAVRNGQILFILGPLKKYLLENGFDWNYKSTLIKNGYIDYLTKMIDNSAAKRIIVPLERKNMEDEIIALEERKAIQNEYKQQKQKMEIDTTAI